LSWKSAATAETLTEEQTEILRALRQEWEAKREAEVQAEEEAWWLDPPAGLLISAVAIQEGREAWRGDACAH